MNFNSRPRVRGDLRKLLLLYREYRFQFSPPREGRQDPKKAQKIALTISILAPA